MVAIKNRDADAFVARPSPAQPIVLLYGPDAGLVHERAEKIIGASVDDTNDPFALVRIDGDALASDPSRLVEEAHTVPLFGGGLRPIISTYDNPGQAQRFSNARGQRDAENRAAKQISDNIRSRLASYFSAGA